MREEIELNGPYGRLRYHEIGDGSYSRVYTPTSDQAIVHVLKKPNRYSISNYRVFRQELDILLVIRDRPHSNLISFLEGYFEDKVYLFQRDSYLAFEYVKGGDLYALLNKGDRLPTRFRYELLRGIAQGLDHLHTRCLMVHRDLKIENIVLDEVEGRVQPKIIDFGMAMVLASPEETLRGVPCSGSPFYVSPETLREKCCSVKSDIYAFSVIMFTMVMLTIPMEWMFDNRRDSSFREPFSLLIEGYREAMSEFIPEAERKMIHDAWAPTAEDRPTAKEIVDYLSFALTNLDLSDLPAPLSRPLRREIKKWREQGPRFGIFDRIEPTSVSNMLTNEVRRVSADEEEHDTSCFGFLRPWLSGEN